MTEHVSVPMNAARVCDAIARIGYQPHSALMDIIDNAIAAQAHQVRVIVDLIEGASFNQRSNISMCRVVDDGKGMSDGEILNALRLGSDANYLPKSLSKYGMGLKSAGFSLGRRIQVTSKQNGVCSLRAYVDREVLATSTDYVVCREVLTPEEVAEFDKLVPGPSGTVVEIGHCERVTTLPARRVLETLQERLGITYFGFLSDDSRKVSITLSCPLTADIQVKPVDILFLDDATKGFDPDTYTGKVPVNLLSEPFEPPADGDVVPDPIGLKIVAFPQQKMSTFASFTDEERKRIDDYRVKREYQGFFIYRNGRLIRWGDTLDGIVGRDAITFRARMDINSSHDDLLHVDVSKQNLNIPTDVLDSLKRIVHTPLQQVLKLNIRCGEIIAQANSEGQVFNEGSGGIPEQDPIDEAAPTVPVEEKKKRIAKKRSETASTLADAGETPVVAPETSELPAFEKVRYSDKVRSNFMWDVGCSETNESFVRVNRNHAFYFAVLSKLDHAGPARMAWEAALWALAVAENKTLWNLDVDQEVIDKVLSRFKRVFSANMEEWCLANQDISTQ